MRHHQGVSYSRQDILETVALREKLDREFGCKKADKLNSGTLRPE